MRHLFSTQCTGLVQLELLLPCVSAWGARLLISWLVNQYEKPAHAHDKIAADITISAAS